MVKIEVNTTAKGTGLITTSAVRKGEVFHRITKYKRVNQPTYTSVQIDLDTHIEESILGKLNHSCNPNLIINTTALECVAARDIEPHEELSFFYPSTEWEMDKPFVCMCGSPQCVRIVAGARYLSLDILSLQFINRHIRHKALSCLEAKVFKKDVIVETIDTFRAETGALSLSVTKA
ncbi:hypothetical protein WA1_40320 [Scytonema hofmannii PCC 7110]|uniref:SET domain-containing protein n=1 Tax=Scytonema hofmannii PCC 7110 TaxID=128403 RepID=A0A139WU73_9CYAN|nr:SET domain-containing protein-lysine N-methyltransferase [Scytonema hofmannii]KYC35995.1 hypothetical protein WA1_40320 [Scytonema hofmannii PCC 7110]